ncbi:MAG: chromosome segregation protein SMC [Candidatus Omnitrophota bacterium]
MFLKSLEIYGFKSFAEKTKLDFEAGVTAIVGPNGCGKSNIADAIRWALGEQSIRSLRGSAMEDVIFHGADNIAPVGFAEVSLTISNHNNFLPIEYEEVTITRRIFRSGESEYLINKVPVRLKDISEILMGTGMGVTSYSSMEQGKVDHILNSRPEERRDIFEEAAGITKYKAKREEALRKLERTNENLQRIGDIIVEVKRQIKSMERQVLKARRYKEEFEKLKEYELKVSQHQYQNLKKEKQRLEQALKELQQQEAADAAKLEALLQSLAAARQDLTQIEERISGTKARNYEIDSSLKTAHNKTLLDKERTDELTRRGLEVAQYIAELERKISSSSELIEQAHAAIQAIEQKKQARFLLLSEKEQSIFLIDDSMKETQKKIAQEKVQEVEVMTHQTKIKNELTKLSAHFANLQARLRRLHVESDKTKTDTGAIEERYQACLNELDRSNEQAKVLTKEVWDLKSNLYIQNEKKEKLQQRLSELSHQITALDSKLHFLREITRNYEGYSTGVKAILAAMENKEPTLAGVSGVVANIIEVSPQYQVPLEMALAEKAQMVVVENSQSAEAVIDFLKQKDAGRVHCLCLDALSQFRPQGIPEADSLGQARKFVSAGPRFQQLIEFLFSDSVIVKDRPAALELLRRNRGRSLRCLTLAGEVISETAVVGGSLPKNMDSSLLGRQKRISDTEEELQKLNQEQADIENLMVFQDAEIKEVSGNIQEKDPQLQTLKIKVANKETEKATIEAEKKRFADETQVLELEMEETNEQITQLESEQGRLNQELLNSEKEQEVLQGKILELQHFIAEQVQIKQNTLVEIAEIKAISQALDKEMQDAQVRLEMIVASTEEQRTTKETQEQQVQENTAKIEHLKEEIGQLERQEKELAQARAQVEEELEYVLQKRQDQAVSIHNFEAQAKEDQHALDVLRQNNSQSQLKLSEITYKQNSITERMQQTYQLDLSSALEDAVEISPLDDAIFEEIAQLRSRLEGIGPVNLIAIEESDQLQQRYDFLIAQQEDLIQAQDSLRKAITQINHTAREMFAETFQKIQENFRVYFRILFNGGDARLILLDENNVLESGIEIVARPPGKKLQNISLLSGGEKAMTAISLLFAIFKVKPSPFCILDEVDAPLDEANIDRFTGLLGEFIKTSQFIIVTHNKKTINMADIMYGITMEKSGVSKIVSVRFTQNQAAPVQPQEAAPVQQ